MKSMKFIRRFRAPRERVFDVCSSFEHAADRIAGIERVEMLTDGPMRVGTWFRETRIMTRVMSPLGRLMAGTMRKLIEKDFDDLQAYLESQTEPEPAPTVG